MKKYKLAIIGSGYLSQIIIKAYKENHLPEFELVGVLVREGSKNKLDNDISTYNNIEDFLNTKPDFTVEAAGKQAMYDYGIKVLEAGSHLVTLSIGALSEDDFKNNLEKTAREMDKKVYIASGAVGGFDVLKTMSLMSPITAKIHSKKNPSALKNTPLYKEGLEEITEITPLLNVTTREAYKLLPTQLNVAIATALASAGVDDTILEMDAYPNFKGDEYTIDVEGEEVSVSLNIYSRTSAIAAWSVIHILNNAISPFVF